MNLSPSYFFFLTFICFIFNRNSSTAPFVKPHYVLIMAELLPLIFFIRGGCFAISEAYDKYPLAVKLHIADLQATYLMEHRTSNMR